VITDYSITLPSGKAVGISSPRTPERDPATGELRLMSGAEQVARVEGWRSVGRVVEAAAKSGPRVSVEDHDAAARRAWKVLNKANDAEDPANFIFRYGDAPCRFERNDEGKLEPRVLDKDRMRYRLNQVANWERQTQNGRAPLPGAPRELVAMVLATPDPPLPLLTRLVDVPVISRNGEVIGDPGYDRRSQVFYNPSPDLTVAHVPRRPKRADVRRARDLLLDDLLGDFPFKGDADRAHAFCLCLEPFVRELIPVNETTPLYAVDAPTPGTGKGLLTRAVSRVAVGGEATLMMPGQDDDEWRKRITSTLLQAPQVVLLDNLSATLDSGSFSALLTTPAWTDRQLGFSRNVTLPNRTTWVVSGNNISMSTELTRRTVRIVLDSGEEHPEDRPATTFRHPQLLRWATDERGDLIWAALVLARYWVVKGKPPGKETIGSFEGWAEVMGGILNLAGVEGLLTNRVEQREQAGSERESMTAFLAGWHERHGGSRMKATEVAPEVWRLVAIDPFHDKAAVAMGYKLKQYADRPFNGLVLRRAIRGDGKLATRSGSGLWYVEPSS
jgi:hypothetical protein